MGRFSRLAGALDGLLQARFADRLQQVVDGAGFERLNGVLVEGGDDHDDRQGGSRPGCGPLRSRSSPASGGRETPGRASASAIFCRASLPLPASPMISTSGNNSNSSRRTRRATGSSSTISVVMRRWSISVRSTSCSVRFTVLNYERPISAHERASFGCRRTGDRGSDWSRLPEGELSGRHLPVSGSSLIKSTKAQSKSRLTSSWKSY